MAPFQSTYNAILVAFRILSVLSNLQDDLLYAKHDAKDGIGTLNPILGRLDFWDMASFQKHVRAISLAHAGKDEGSFA